MLGCGDICNDSCDDKIVMKRSVTNMIKKAGWLQKKAPLKHSVKTCDSGSSTASLKIK